MKVNGIKVYDVSSKVITYYRESVKGNEHSSELDIKLKLSRNILLAEKLTKNIFTGKATYAYGNLLITCKRGKVVLVSNHPMNSSKTWKLDKKKYMELNKLLGIKDCKFTRNARKVK